MTYPLSVNLQGLAGVKSVRATSMFGFALVTLIFEDNVSSVPTMTVWLGVVAPAM